MPRKKPTSKSRTPNEKPKLLSGGNPQIEKGDGDAPVQAYIAAMPEWKQGVGRQIDTMIVRTVPEIQKAVRRNTVFYGIKGNGWSICYHCFTRYVKLSFLNGGSLEPAPPEKSKYPAVRSVYIHEADALDDDLLESWIRQSSDLPGNPLF
jgi:hypothetical protein